MRIVSSLKQRLDIYVRQSIDLANCKSISECHALLCELIQTRDYCNAAYSLLIDAPLMSRLSHLEKSTDFRSDHPKYSACRTLLYDINEVRVQHELAFHGPRAQSWFGGLDLNFVMQDDVKEFFKEVGGSAQAVRDTALDVQRRLNSFDEGLEFFKTTMLLSTATVSMYEVCYKGNRSSIWLGLLATSVSLLCWSGGPKMVDLLTPLLSKYTSEEPKAQSISFDLDKLASYSSRMIGMYLVSSVLRTYSEKSGRIDNLFDDLSWNFRNASSVSELLRAVTDSIFQAMNYVSTKVFGCDIVNPMSGTCNELQKWVTDVNNFQREMDRGTHDFDIEAFDYLNLLEERISYLLIDSKKSQYGDVVFKVINMHRAKLMSIRNVFVQMNLRPVSSRPSPLGISLFGPPGVGKSYSIEMLTSAIYSRCFTDKEKLHYGDDMARITWYKPKNSKFADGYKAHPIGVIDDAFNTKDSTANPDTDATDIIRWINTAPALMNSAEMGLKAINQCKMRLVVLNTNLRSLDGLTSITDVGAIARRLHIPVLVSVCPAFRKDPNETDLWKVQVDYDKFPKDHEGVPIAMTKHYEFHMLDLKNRDLNGNYLVLDSMDYDSFVNLCCQKFQRFNKEHNNKVEHMESSKAKYQDVYVRKGCTYQSFILEMDRKFFSKESPNSEDFTTRYEFDLLWYEYIKANFIKCKKTFQAANKEQKIVYHDYFRFLLESHEVALPHGIALGYLEWWMKEHYDFNSPMSRYEKVIDYHTSDDSQKLEMQLPLGSLKLTGTFNCVMYGLCVINNEHVVYKFDHGIIKNEFNSAPQAQSLTSYFERVSNMFTPQKQYVYDFISEEHALVYLHAFQEARPYLLSKKGKGKCDYVLESFRHGGVANVIPYFSYIHNLAKDVFSSKYPGVRLFVAVDRILHTDYTNVELNFVHDVLASESGSKIDADFAEVKACIDKYHLTMRAFYNSRYGLFSGALPNWSDMWNEVIFNPDFSYGTMVKNMALGFGMYGLIKIVISLLSFLFSKLSEPMAQAAAADEPKSSVSKSSYFDQTGEAIGNILLKSNTYELLNDTGNRINYILFYCGTRYVTNAHCLDNLEHKSMSNPDAVLKLRNLHSKQVQMEVPIKEFLRNFKIPERDLGFGEISVNFVAPKRDIRKFFITKKTSMPDKFLARWVVPSDDRMNDYEREVKKLSYSRLEKTVPEAFIKDDKFRYLNGVTDKYVTSAEGYFYKNSHNSGDCGAPLYTMDPAQRQQRIFSIHASGMTKSVDSYATAIFFEDLELADGKVNDNFVCQFLEEPKTQSKYEDEFEVVSKYPNKSSQMTETMLTESQFHNILGPVDLQPSDLSMPLKKCMSKYSKVKPAIDPQILKVATKHAYATILSANQERGPVRYTKRSFGEAVWGIDGNKYFKGLAMSTSSGAPHLWQVRGVNGKKTFLGNPDAIGPYMRNSIVDMFNYIYDNDCFDKEALKSKYSIVDDDVTHPMYMDLRFLPNIHFIIDPIKEFIRKAKAKELTEVLFVDYLKDELLKKGKDPRIFSCSPCWFTIVTRMYLGHFIEVCMANNSKNGISVGINPYSEDWDHMAKRLKTFPNLGDTDFKSYDTSHSAQLNMENATAMNDYVYHYDELESLVVVAIFMAIAHSLHVTDDFCVIRWLGSLPSGCPLTTILNCINQLILFRICWMVIFSDIRAILTFNSHVILWAFGDDGNRCVSDYAKDIYTPEAISEVMKSCGFDITAGNKQGIGTYGDLSSISYLKRTFVFNEVLNRYVGPLAKKSICKMLYWTKKKPNKDEIVRSNLNKALLESSFHGKAYFDEVSNAISKQCEEIGFPFPDVIDYRSAVYANSQREPEFYECEDSDIDFFMPVM
nr:MAG: nonstructural protein [Riboviria sp.]